MGIGNWQQATRTLITHYSLLITHYSLLLLKIEIAKGWPNPLISLVSNFFLGKGNSCSSCLGASCLLP
ncbi:MAG: hypothetical protein F6K47_12230 [Symploca sp. SIO2E6]|nr:hypothetical protein [Symploca sp. SIO2E6]